MINIFDYWWLMDYLALEWVEDWGSILLGYVAFCVTLTTLAPFPFLAWWFRKRNAAVYAALVLAWLALSVWALVTYQVHHVWNGYQHWYTTPLDPGWMPITPENAIPLPEF